MRKSPCGTFFGLRQRSKRAYTPRADGKSKNKPHRRAQLQIQKFSAARAIRAKTCSGYANTKWLPPGRFSLSSFGRHVILESEYVRDGSPDDLTERSREVYMRVSIAVCEAPEQTEKVRRTFSHVIADASGPRDAVRYLSILTSRASGGLCHRAKGPPGGAFGQRWSLPVRRA